MKTLAALVSLMIPVAFATTAQAADPLYSQPAGYCTQAMGGQLMSITDNATLTAEVTQRMDHAVQVAEDPRWVNSARPAFTWANETKAACGIAFGYLKTQYRDDEFVSKCECFHERMVQYMN